MGECILRARPLPAFRGFAICSPGHEARELLAFLRARGATLSMPECAALGVRIHLAVGNVARSLESVSYTHLRAHETSAHL
eukprot:2421304-Alexandrium_andersonii.AAC.1